MTTKFWEPNERLKGYIRSSDYSSTYSVISTQETTGEPETVQLAEGTALGRLPSGEVAALDGEDLAGLVSAYIEVGEHSLLSETHADTTAATVVKGDVIVGDSSGDPVVTSWRALPGNTTTTKKYLSQTGTGEVSDVPAWSQPSASDLSDGVQGSGAVVLATSPTITSPSISKLSNLSTNGFVKTSGSDGTLSVDTSTYLTALPAHTLMGSSHSDTWSATPVKGDMIAANYVETETRWDVVSGNTSATKKYLSQTGTGSASAFPVWDQPSLSDLSDASNIVTLDLCTDTQEPTGFLVAGAGGTLSWSDGTRTLTITGSHTVYIKGVKYSKTTDSKQIADTTGVHFIYYDAAGAIAESTAFPGFYLPLIASVYWNSSTAKGLAADERHGCTMDGATHEYLHDTVGTRYASGLAGTFAASSFSIALGEIFDEDIGKTITPAQTACNVLYKNGSAAWKWDAAASVYYKLNGSNLRYNSGNSLADAGSNEYVAAWIFATLDLSYPIVAILGQRVDSTLANARANNTYESLSLGTLPFPEMKLLYRVILRNTGSPPTYVEAQDLRTVSNLSTGTYVATLHSALSGLSADDHTQYVCVDGRSGGQTIYGGTAASENLTLRSTSNATKGNFLIGGSLTSAGTSAVSCIAIASGTAPSAAYPADAAGIYVADRGGTAGAAAIHLWAEGGTKHVLGDRVGLGTTSPSAFIHALATTEQLRLGYDVSNYASFTVNSAGNLLIDPTGTFEARATYCFFGSGAQTFIYDDTWGFNYNTDADSVGYLNYGGYQAGSTRYRSLQICNGKAVGFAYFDGVNSRFGVGVGSTVSAKMHVLATTEQLRLGYDVTNYTSFTVSIDGDLTVDPYGDDITFDGRLILNNKPAPSAPTDGVALYSANRGATAGKAGLHLLAEDGTGHVFSDLVGIGTTAPTAYLHVKAGTTTCAPFKLTTGDLLTTAEAGAFGFNNSAFFLSPADSLRYAVAGCVFASTASVTINNSNTETSLVGAGEGSMTFPANSLVVGRTIYIRAYGTYTMDVTSCTMTWRVKYGTTTLASGSVTAASAETNLGWFLDWAGTIRTVGATGTMFSSGDIARSRGANIGLYNTAATTIDTTAATAFGVTFQFGTALAADTFYCNSVICVIVR